MPCIPKVVVSGAWAAIYFVDVSANEMCEAFMYPSVLKPFIMSRTRFLSYGSMSRYLFLDQWHIFWPKIRITVDSIL